MDIYEIEQLISEAIENRPTVTTAPMNLYIHKNKIICGARTLMPRNAAFISHLTPDQIENGFNEKQWKLIVMEAREIAGPANLAANIRKYAVAGQIKSNHEKSLERRTEQRLPHRSTMRFATEAKEMFLSGKMRDVSSGGMAFTCTTKKDYLRPDQEIIAQFSVPRFNPNNSYDTVSYERKGQIRRIDKIDNSLYSVALQFTRPLNFKPAENHYAQTDAREKTVTI